MTAALNNKMGTNNVAVRPVKTQTSLGIHTVWSVFTICTKNTLTTHWEQNEYSDQAWWMTSLPWVFAWHTFTLLVNSWWGSYEQQQALITIRSKTLPSTCKTCRNINKHNWAATCDFQQCGILTSVDSDEPVQPPFKLRNSKWCLVSSLTLVEYTSD